ncbi:MAG: LPS assembly lipoprotein LptE [Pseudomonadota bacterium]
MSSDTNDNRPGLDPGPHGNPRRLTRRAALLSLTALAGCGFQPVYRKGGAAAALQNQIAIDVVRGRNGFELREHLETRLGRAGPAAPYVLTFKLTIAESGVAVTEDEGTTRENLLGTAAFTVRRIDTGAIVFKDSVRNITAYSTTSRTFPSATAETDANVRLARVLADQIAERIALTAGDWAA